MKDLKKDFYWMHKKIVKFSENIHKFNDAVNEFGEEIHKQNVEMKWWDEPNPSIVQKIDLVFTELAEATEGDRKNKMDDHLTHRKMEEVELADALIRMLDLGNYLGLLYLSTYRPNRFLSNDLLRLLLNYEKQSEKHAICHLIASKFLEEYIDIKKSDYEYYSIFIDALILTAHAKDYDLFGAAQEKVKYNRTRPDHKKENREKKHGKDY